MESEVTGGGPIPQDYPSTLTHTYIFRCQLQTYFDIFLFEDSQIMFTAPSP